MSLNEIVEDATKKFVISGERLFSVKLFMQQLTYTKDVEDKHTALNLIIKEQIIVGEIEAFLRQQVAAFLDDKTLREDVPYA